MHLKRIDHQLHARAWFEYVESKDNWSDGASRLGRADPFCLRHHFRVECHAFPASLWRLRPTRSERCVRIAHTCHGGIPGRCPNPLPGAYVIAIPASIGAAGERLPRATRR